jgi:hypothetical protein
MTVEPHYVVVEMAPAAYHDLNQRMVIGGGHPMSEKTKRYRVTLNPEAARQIEGYIEETLSTRLAPDKIFHPLAWPYNEDPPVSQWPLRLAYKALLARLKGQSK